MVFYTGFRYSDSLGIPRSSFGISNCTSVVIDGCGNRGKITAGLFRSLFLFHMRKLKADTLYRGRKIEKEKTHTFYSHYTYSVKKNRFRKQKHGFSGFLTYR